MKEDILEQLAEDYLRHLGYFTLNNVKYRPLDSDPDATKKDDCVHSDIDILAVHPKKRGAHRVIAVSCKSWMMGFSPNSIIDAIDNHKKLSGREAWKGFRELAVPKWSRAFRTKIKELTGQSQFTYWTLVARLKGDAAVWEQHKAFRKQLGGNPIRLVTLEEVVTIVLESATTTPAPSELGRMLQLIAAAGLTVVPKR